MKWQTNAQLARDIVAFKRATASLRGGRESEEWRRVADGAALACAFLAALRAIGYAGAA